MNTKEIERRREVFWGVINDPSVVKAMNRIRNLKAVTLVMDTSSSPGRETAGVLLKCGDDEQLRKAYDARTVACAGMAVEMFNVLAEGLDESMEASLKAAVKRTLAKGMMPVIVMAANGAMTMSVLTKAAAADRN